MIESWLLGVSVGAMTVSALTIAANARTIRLRQLDMKATERRMLEQFDTITALSMKGRNGGPGDSTLPN